MNIEGHAEEISCHIADIGNHQIVLGTSWLKIHNPEINWGKQTIKFHSSHCQGKCLDVPNILQLSSGIIIPEAYKQFQDVFLEKETAHLPPQEIKLIPGTKIKHGPIYSTGPKEEEEL
ncbi:retrotransposable element Tf2 155 kDa type-like protein, putative [Rhizoctonia solani AG-3 Rhs1AP]|uniref:Retrotransposable element Tf2 155 kDa type-like protein, putative n=2 Tax=Rhizoctonia solani AG-3 TaxID=1086053 RepID=A0A0A1UK12_9AGAM|nr:retrotransposable element Tf2 155 kDa type-like protein, putative [Rhizoctonia solani AG-3 Rhs1AP]